jgi:hypothetical protein
MKQQKMFIVAKIMEVFFSVLRVFSIFWLDFMYAAMLFFLPSIIMGKGSHQFQEHILMEQNVGRVMDEVYNSSRLIVNSHSNHIYDKDILKGKFYFTDEISKEEKLVLSPYNAEYVADYDESDNKYFWVYTTNIPKRDCKYMLEKKWKKALVVYSPENCQNEKNNIIAVKYE